MFYNGWDTKLVFNLVKQTRVTYYDLILDSTRRYFFEDFSNIATASNAIMVDDCASPNGVAYKVYMPETTFELFNNKFRKDVTFRIIA